MAEGTLLFDRAAMLRPDAKSDVIDMRVDVTVAVKCRCADGRTFLVGLHIPGKCAGCGTSFGVKTMRLLSDRNDVQAEVSVGPIGPTASAIVTPN